MDRRLSLVAALALLLGPILIDLCMSGTRRLFGYVAADVFYYLQVGRNLGWHGLSSYDGTHLTNGYHPLWQLIVALGYALRLPGMNSEWALLWLIAFGLMLMVAAVVLLHAAYRRTDADSSLAFVLLPVGIYALLACPFWLTLSLPELARQNRIEGSEPLYGTLWSYVNGMETPLVLFAFAGTLRHFVRSPWTPSSATRAGLWLATLTLARLDHALIALPLAGLGVFLAHDRRAALSLMAAWLGPLAVYLLINRAVFGVWAPVSGSVKSSFPHAEPGNWAHVAAVVHRVTGQSKPPIFTTWRVLQLTLPAVFAAAQLLALGRLQRGPRGVAVRWSPPGRLGAALLATGVGAVMLAAYDFLFVPLRYQGHWYVPVSVVYVTLVCLAARERLPRPRLGVVGRGVVVCALAGLQIAFFLRLHRHTDYHARYATFYFDEAPALRALTPPPRLLSFDDGIVEWATGLPGMTATGYCLDPEAARARKEGRLLPLALSRGYDHLTSAFYIRWTDLPPDPQERSSWLPKHLTRWFGSLDGRTFEVRYQSPSKAVALIKVR